MKRVVEIEGTDIVSFKDGSGQEWKLAIVSEKAFGGIHNAYAFVDERKETFLDGVSSGGNTGACYNGYNRVAFDAEDNNVEFIQFVKA